MVDGDAVGFRPKLAASTTATISIKPGISKLKDSNCAVSHAVLSLGIYPTPRTMPRLKAVLGTVEGSST